METVKLDDGHELYNEDGLRIVGKYVDENSIWGTAVLLYIENNTGKNIGVQADDMSINGFMVQPFFSATVYDGKMSINDITIMQSDLDTAKHEVLISDVRKQINDSLQEMVGSETYPNITAISANDDFTNFTVTTKNKELDFAESLGVMTLYIYGGMYAVFSGEEVDNIHVEFVNADSGEVISSGDSKDMKF
ncbi:MAG: hypothetical protein J6N70_07865 [Oribacterium sp.]|nr:hypothetical protein [Oribacterium sp.]